MSAATGDHAAPIDSNYRGQRHIYDATRKYYLFGRDRLIASLACRPGDSVLEITCGTERILDRIGQKWPMVRLFGLDISNEMLISASGRLGAGAQLAQGDARDFDAATTLGQKRFDRVVLSYSLSMIPDWERALRHAASLVAPGGSLHLVDFGTLEELPRPLAAALRGSLAKFHVEPRIHARRLAAGLRARSARLRMAGRPLRLLPDGNPASSKRLIAPRELAFDNRQPRPSFAGNRENIQCRLKCSRPPPCWCSGRSSCCSGWPSPACPR